MAGANRLYGVAKPGTALAGDLRYEGAEVPFIHLQAWRKSRDVVVSRGLPEEHELRGQGGDAPGRLANGGLQGDPDTRAVAHDEQAAVGGVELEVEVQAIVGGRVGWRGPGPQRGEVLRAGWAGVKVSRHDELAPHPGLLGWAGIDGVMG